MGDDALRNAERRWRESNAADDGRRYLARLVRAGEGRTAEALRLAVQVGALHPERLRLAAHVGHEPARAALEPPPAASPPLHAWARELFEWGHAACVRAAVAAARRVLEVQPFALPDDDEGHPRRAIEAAEAWLACPCPDHYARGEAFNRLKTRLPAWAWHTVTAAHCPPRSCWHHVEALQEVVRATPVGEDGVRAAVRDALVAWALPDAGGDAPLVPPPVSAEPEPPPPGPEAPPAPAEGKKKPASKKPASKKPARKRPARKKP